MKERQKHQIDHLVIDDYFSWNLFYGASPENANKCGARVVFNLVPLIISLSRWVLEKGPITGLSYQQVATLFRLIFDKNVSNFQVYGDSKLLVDRLNGKFPCRI